MVIRPKSSATVVVLLRSTPLSTSTCVPGSVSGSSVRSGRISVTDPTSVVLPAPNPPAIRILMVTGACPGSRPYGSEPPKAIGHLSQNSRVGQFGRWGRVVHADERPGPQVRQQDLDHSQ